MKIKKCLDHFLFFFRSEGRSGGGGVGGQAGVVGKNHFHRIEIEKNVIP